MEATSPSIKFVFPHEGNHSILLKKNVLALWTDSSYQEEVEVNEYPSQYLNLVIKHLKNPELNFKYDETDKIYQAADHLNIVKLKDKIVRSVAHRFPKIESLQEQLILSDRETRKDLYGRAIKLHSLNNSSPSMWNMNTILSPVNYLVSSVSKLFYDGKHGWKDHRYGAILNELINCYGLENLKNEQLLKAIAEPLITNEKTCRNRYKTYIKNFREAYQKGEEKERLQTMAVQHFTEVSCLTFLAQLCLFLAIKQNPCFLSKILNSDQYAFSEKCRLLADAIGKVDSTYTKPVTHIYYNKAEKLLPGFDSLGNGNMPWHILNATFNHPEHGSRSIDFIRSGVPVNDEGIVPEFEAFVEGLKAEKKKLAVIVHLNPKFFDSQTLKAQEIINDLKVVDRKESKWIEKIVEMENKYPKTMDVFVLPFDGKWIKELENEKPMTLRQMKEYLSDIILGKDSPFLLSQSTREDQGKIVEITTLLEQVASTYYVYKEENAVLSSEEKKAFLALFYHDLTHYYAFKYNCDVVLNHCTDGRDRTGIMLMTLAAMLHDLNNLKIDETCRIIGTAFGPAAALAKQAPHPHRLPYMLAILKQLELSKPKDIYNRGQGWKVEEFNFRERPCQTLIPGPFETHTKEDYQLRIREEEELPFVLPKKIEMPSLEIQMAEMTNEVLYKQCDSDLKRQKIFFGTMELEVQDVITFYNGFLKESCEIKDEKLCNQILYFLSQGALASPLQVLKSRYHNAKLNIEVVSGFAEEKVQQHTQIELIENTYEISIIRKFPICSTMNRERMGTIKMKMTARFDPDKGASTPLLGWSVSRPDRSEANLWI